MHTESPRPGIPWGSMIGMAAILATMTSGGLWVHNSLGNRLDTMSTRIGKVEQAVQLYRFEQSIEQGLGMTALVEQIRHWAPLLGSASTPIIAIPKIKQRLDDVYSAMLAIDQKEAMDRLIREFESCEPGAEDEIALWILRGMTRIDAPRSSDFIGRVIEGFDFRVSSRLRLMAADVLLLVDTDHAGERLHRVLERESHRGLSLDRVPPDLRSRITNGAGQIPSYPGFFNFVSRYVMTGHKDIEATLMMILGRKEHDLTTVQACVKELGAMKSNLALEQIQKLFEVPPNHSDNPIFRNHCLDAISKIFGPGNKACSYFQNALRHEQSGLVQNKLKGLIKTHCQ